MAGKVGSASFGVLLVDGYDFLASKLKAFTHKVTALQERSDGLGDSLEAMSPTGLVKLEITQAGAFFDDTTNQTHTLLATIANLAVSRLICAAFAGNTIGKPFLGLSGAYGMAYDVLGQVGSLTKANVTYNVSGSLDRGVILNQSVAKTVDWNTKTDGNQVDYTTDTSQRNIPISNSSVANPTVVTTPVPHGLTSGDIILIAGSNSTPTIDGSRVATVTSTTTFTVPVNVSVQSTTGSFVRANTSFGAVGYQAVSAFSGFTGFVGKIRDSPDDVTYADLITFTNVTSAPNAQRVTNGVEVVDRYLSFNGDVTGAGSITVFVGCARVLP